MGWNSGYHILRGRMRQAANRRVNARPVDIFGARQRRHINIGKLRIYFRQFPSSMGIAGKRGNARARMGSQQPHGIGTGVTGSAYNGDIDLRHAHFFLSRRFGSRP